MIEKTEQSLKLYGRSHKYFLFIGILLFLSLTGLMSCNPTEFVKLDFVNGEASVFVESPKEGLTTMCRVSIIGNSECDLKVLIPSSGPVCIIGGRVDFWCNYEWYDEEKSIVVLQDNGCQGISELTLGYEFSGQYFGQSKKSGNIDCR